MKKILTKISAVILLFLLSTQGVLAVDAPNYWKKVGNAIRLLNDSWTLGSSGDPIPLGYFDVLNVGGVNVGDALGSAGGNTFNNLNVSGDIQVSIVPAPLSAPSPSLSSPAAAGNVDDGDHRYVITYLSTFGETAPSLSSSAVTVTDKTVNGQVVLTLPTSPNTSILSRKIYRQFNGSGNFKLLATIPNNASTSYTDNIANASLGANVPVQNTTGSLDVDGNITAQNLSLANALPITDGGTGATTASAARGNLGLTLGTDVQPWSGQLESLASLATDGILVHTASETIGARTLTGTSNQVVVTNGDGVAGNPTFSLPQDIATTSIPSFGGFHFYDADVTHPLTDALPANNFGLIGSQTATSGGLAITGAIESISNANTPALALNAYVGDDGYQGPAAMKFNIGQSDGGTGVTAMSSDNTLYSFNNGGWPLMDIVADTSYSSGKLLFYSGDYPNPVTDLLPASAWGQIKATDPEFGGMQLTSTTLTNDVNAIEILGVKGAVGGGASPAVVIKGAKRSGTGVVDMGDNDSLFQIWNNDNAGTYAFSVDGSGDIEAGGVVSSNGGFRTVGNAFYVDETGAAQTVSMEVIQTLSTLGRFTQDQDSVASANNLDLGGNTGNIYHITGTTQINCINPGASGAVLILIFDSSPVVDHNATCSGANLPLYLKNADAFNTSANTVLQLFADTTAIREISRTEVP